MDRVKLGFTALESLYGSTNTQRNEMAFMAVQQKDQEFAKQMFARIGNDWSASVWRSKERYEQSRGTLAPVTAQVNITAIESEKCGGYPPLHWDPYEENFRLVCNGISARRKLAGASVSNYPP